MLEISSLCSGYGKKEILHQASLICKKGEITTLIGPNGCGKSTLLKTVTGMIVPTQGDIKIDGVSVKAMPDNIRAQKIAYLSQGKNIPDITVGSMVLHGRFPYLSYPRKYRKSDYEAAEVAMDKMGIGDLAESPVSRLSGGMRQKVYIAMALCQGADVIMLDEPATYLDISQQLKLSDILTELAAEGKALLTVSHDIISSLKISDRIVLMDEGIIKASGTPEEILESGLIPLIFGVDIISYTDSGITEYFYRAKKDMP